MRYFVVTKVGGTIQDDSYKITDLIISEFEEEYEKDSYTDLLIVL